MGEVGPQEGEGQKAREEGVEEEEEEDHRFLPEKSQKETCKFVISLCFNL